MKLISEVAARDTSDKRIDLIVLPPGVVGELGKAYRRREVRPEDEIAMKMAAKMAPRRRATDV